MYREGFLCYCNLHSFIVHCSYKEAFNKLKELKTEIEHLQHFLEKSKVKLLKDFELWWAEQASLQVNMIYWVIFHNFHHEIW